MRKGFSLLIIIIVVGLLIVPVGAFYLGRLTFPISQTSNSIVNIKSPSIIPNLTTPIDTKTVDKFTFINDGDINVFDLKTKNTQKITSYGYNVSPILSPDNSKIAYLSIPDVAIRAREVQKFSGSGYFDQPTSYGESDGLRNIWIINTDGTNPVQVTKDPKKRSGSSWSSDSKKISFTEDGEILEYNLDNDTLLNLGEGTDPIYAPDNNGRAFVFDNNKTLQVFNSGGGEAFTHNQDIYDLDWPSEENIYFTSIQRVDGPTYKWKFSIWAWPFGDQLKQITAEKDRIHGPLVSPDGKYIAASSGSGYADVGNMDLTLVVLKMNNDLTIEKQIKLKDFKGSDFFEQNKEFMFPSGRIVWLNNKEFLVILDVLNAPEPDPQGLYKFNMDNLTTERLLEL